MVKIGIVDDEQIFCEMIRDILLQKFDDITIYTYNSVKQLDEDFDFILICQILMGLNMLKRMKIKK